MISALHISLIGLFSLVILFHIMVLVKIVPYNIVWGGRLKSDAHMYRLELISLFVTVFFLGVILVKSRILLLPCPEGLLNLILWIMVILFALNTVGNLFSKSRFERIVFTPLTLSISILTLMLILGDFR